MKQTIKELLNEFQNTTKNPEKITFLGVSEDVYNITAPFKNRNEIYIASRVEKREDENSSIIFFKKEDDVYKADLSIAQKNLQDPFICFINNEIIFGGVQTKVKNNIITWRTLMYKGKDLESLELFFTGPMGMKDLRIVQMGKDILVVTRPQKGIAGRGKIGLIKIKNLEGLSIEVINSALIIEQFDDLEWGGANCLYELSNGNIGVLGHIANFDEFGNRHYYAMSFEIFENLEYSKMKIIAKRELFLDGPSKREDLKDVIFSGGLSDGYLYVGVSDCEAHRIEIENPFSSKII